MESKTIFLKVLTPLHIGVGSGIGHIDLPIYREVPTNFPMIPASSLKGVLRQKWLENTLEKTGLDSLNEYDKKVENGDDNTNGFVKTSIEIFGSQNKEGSLIVSDSRILFFPVKSAKGIFAYITCPFVLKRFSEDTGINVGEVEDIIENDKAIVLNDEKIVFKNSENKNKNDNEKNKNLVIFEDFSFTVERKGNNDLWNLAKNIDIDKKRIAIVSDDIFSQMVESYTEIQTHTKIDLKTGVVSENALWVEEYVPPETVFYTKLDLPKNEDFENFIKEIKTLRIGGNTTTGKGLVEVIQQ